MSQGTSCHDAEHPRAGHLKNARAREARRQACARLPMLDWPRQLFGDNATMADLTVEDFVSMYDQSRYDPSGVAIAYQETCGTADA